MRPRIGIPYAHSTKHDFSKKCMPQYAHAVELAGGVPVEIPVNATNAEIMRVAMTCEGFVLPGSPADVNPERYGQARDPKTAPDDPARDNADELLLQDAYNMHKPLLGICFGIQSLNTWRTGTLVQHLETGVRHTKGEDEEIFHPVRVTADSKLAHILGVSATVPHVREANVGVSHTAALLHDREVAEQATADSIITTNTSHHQAIETPGDGLCVVAWSAQDNVIEAVEGTSDDHFVLGIQWHPERTVEGDPNSLAIFRALVEAARHWHAHPRNPLPDFETIDKR